ncbi:hypothetical protein A9Q84_18955 [Halobacteriovorax marinus]|uniref:HTH araC/xylS-type domain-containing protein n=1 Tax=Halobacteriovorax marinus TaxID=97084 RepID=A0A1Y5F674_9BACT|nr:hypothetical protein A9Q84_18955 [Halobacteriovorax marinus]
MSYVSKEIYLSIVNCSEKLGICLDKLPESEQYSESEIIQLYQKLIVETDENIGIYLGRVFEFSDIGVFGELVSRSLTIQKMMKLMSLFQGHLCKELIIKSKVIGNFTEVVIKLNRNSFKEISRQVHDVHIFAFLNYINQTFSETISPEKIIFSYEKPKNIEIYESLKMDYEFGAEESKLIFKNEDFTFKNPLYSEGEYRLMKKRLISYFIPNIKYIEELRTYISTNLGKNKISLREFSNRNSVSLRRIERELEKKGISFGDLTIDCRIEKLKYLINSPLDFSDIALELGLYDQSSLNNFTMKYLNKTPLEMR